mmetsp:Transcript_8990/g.23233  ORF Transcript_8990/g.23233 Transcript_8990/m.23233 type:complete len:298 (-) Transcript_8990:266-1159(-)
MLMRHGIVDQDHEREDHVVERDHVLKRLEDGVEEVEAAQDRRRQERQSDQGRECPQCKMTSLNVGPQGEELALKRSPGLVQLILRVQQRLRRVEQRVRPADKAMNPHCEAAEAERGADDEVDQPPPPTLVNKHGQVHGPHVHVEHRATACAEEHRHSVEEPPPDLAAAAPVPSRRPLHAEDGDSEDGVVEGDEELEGLEDRPQNARGAQDGRCQQHERRQEAQDNGQVVTSLDPGAYLQDRCLDVVRGFPHSTRRALRLAPRRGLQRRVVGSLLHEVQPLFHLLLCLFCGAARSAGD